MAGLNLNEEYVLIKSFPNCKAGEVFIVKDDMHGNLYLMIVNKISIAVKDIDNFDEWFAKKSKKWKPKVGKKYYYIPVEGNIGESMRRDGNRGFDEGFFDMQFKFGNIFETQADAEFCRDEYIKKSFKKFHEDYPPGSPRG